MPRHKPARMVKFGGSEARRVLPGCVVHRGVDFCCENEVVMAISNWIVEACAFGCQFYPSRKQRHGPARKTKSLCEMHLTWVTPIWSI